MTRYPKQGKGRRWTVKELGAIDRTWRGDTISDGDGLSGEVRVAPCCKLPLARDCVKAAVHVSAGSARTLTGWGLRQPLPHGRPIGFCVALLTTVRSPRR
jgi:hypothetical protein